MKEGSAHRTLYIESLFIHRADIDIYTHYLHLPMTFADGDCALRGRSSARTCLAKDCGCMVPAVLYLDLA